MSNSSQLFSERNTAASSAPTTAPTVSPSNSNLAAEIRGANRDELRSGRATSLVDTLEAQQSAPSSTTALQRSRVIGKTLDDDDERLAAAVERRRAEIADARATKPAPQAEAAFAVSSGGSSVIPASAPEAAVAESTSGGFWSNAWSSVKGFCSKSVEIGTGIAKGIYKIGEFAVTEAVPFLFSEKCWSAVGSAAAWVGSKLIDPDTWVAAGKFAFSCVTWAQRAAWNVITNPVDSLRAAGSFLKSMSDGLGLTDLAVGLGRLCTGDLRGGLQALKGAGTAFLEFTGIADLGRAVYHGGLALYYLGTGDKLQAAIHGGQALMNGAFAVLSIGSIAATVATGGAAAGAIVGVMALRTSLSTAAKQVVKTACKEFLKESGEKIGKELVENLAKTVSRDVLTQAGEKIANQGTRDLAIQHLGREGAQALLSRGTADHVRAELATKLLQKAGPEAFEQVMEKHGIKVGDRLMKDMGITERVAKLTEQFVRDTRGKSAKDLAAELLEAGVVKNQKEALSTAKELQRILKGAGKASDKELCETLTEGIMKPLREHVNSAVREGFEKQMRTTLKGAPEKQLDEAIEAGWRGAERGLEKSMRKAVYAGVKEGLNRSRAKFVKLGLDGDDQTFAIGTGERTHASGEVDAKGIKEKPEHLVTAKEEYDGSKDWIEEKQYNDGENLVSLKLAHHGNKTELISRNIEKIAGEKKTQTLTEKASGALLDYVRPLGDLKALASDLLKKPSDIASSGGAGNHLKTLGYDLYAIGAGTSMAALYGGAAFVATAAMPATVGVAASVIVAGYAYRQFSKGVRNEQANALAAKEGSKEKANDSPPNGPANSSAAVVKPSAPDPVTNSSILAGAELEKRDQGGASRQSIVNSTEVEQVGGMKLSNRSAITRPERREDANISQELAADEERRRKVSEEREIVARLTATSLSPSSDGAKMDAISALSTGATATKHVHPDESQLSHSALSVAPGAFSKNAIWEERAVIAKITPSQAENLISHQASEDSSVLAKIGPDSAAIAKRRSAA